MEILILNQHLCWVLTHLGLGKDETALVILEQLPFDVNIFVSYLEIIPTTDLSEVIGRVLFLSKFYKFKKIIIDETGLGGGVVDVLKSKMPGGKVEGIWYTQKSKAEMFTNLKLLMMKQKGGLFLPDYLHMNDAIIKKMYYQFLAITQVYKDGDATRLPKISHEQRTHDDLVNAICLAAMYFKVGGNQKKRYLLGGFN